MIGDLGDSPTVADLSNAHSRIYEYSINHYCDVSSKEQKKWCETASSVLAQVVKQLGNGDVARERIITNILSPLRKSVESTRCSSINQ